METETLSERDCRIIALLRQGLDWGSALTAAGVADVYQTRAKLKARLLRKVDQPDFTALRLWASPISDRELARLTGRLKPLALSVHV